MTFGDMLTYEENCVKEALALPNLNVTITMYDTYSDCEMCGAYSSTVLEVEGDLGGMVSGDYAHCLSNNEDGSFQEVAMWLNARLEEHGRPTPTLLDSSAKDAAEGAYYDQVADCSYDYYDPSLQPFAENYEALLKAYDAYYTPKNLIQLYAEFGVTILEDYKEDEIYDANDWGDDYENEEEECED